MPGFSFANICKKPSKITHMDILARRAHRTRERATRSRYKCLFLTKVLLLGLQLANRCASFLHLFAYLHWKCALWARMSVRPSVRSSVRIFTLLNHTTDMNQIWSNGRLSSKGPKVVISSQNISSLQVQWISSLRVNPHIKLNRPPKILVSQY